MISIQKTAPAGIVLLVTALMLSACSVLAPPKLPQPFDDNYDPIITYLSRLIAKEMKAGDLEGLSIALVSDQAILWSEGFGMADREQSTPATELTRYRAGSVSKVVNAFAVMQLQEQGKLDLDAPLARYVPEFSIISRFGSTDDITLRTLLAHQSGLPSDWIDGMWSHEPAALQSLLPALSEAHTIAPANSFFNYSNVGVSLSGLAVQSVTGEPYEQYMQNAILQTLDMNDSDFSGSLTGKQSASAYIDGELTAEIPLRDTPAGGLNTTVVDLAKFLRAVHADGQPLVQKRTFDDMRRAQNEGRPLDLGQRVGLGWFVRSVPLGGRFEVLWHSGRTVAHSTMLATAPELDIGVVIMTNSADPTNALDRIAREAMQQLYLTKGLPAEENPPGAAATLKLNTSRELAGHYAGNVGLVSIEPDGDRFSALAFDTRISLRPEDGHWFSPRIMLWFIPLRPDELKALEVSQATIEGQARLIGKHEGNLFLLGDRVEPYPSSDRWDRHLGQYAVQNPVEVPWMRVRELHFKRAEHYYFLEVTDAGGEVVKMPVRPLNDQQFIILGTGRGLGDTVTLTGEADESVFTLSGLIYKRMKPSME